jgi:hypothetical protein
MKKPAGALASALRKSGATVGGVRDDEPATVSQHKLQPSREGTAPITVHLPRVVRTQLKTLAAEQERKIEDMVSEALNLLFAKHRKPEIAPRRPA